MTAWLILLSLTLLYVVIRVVMASLWGDLSLVLGLWRLLNRLGGGLRLFFVRFYLFFRDLFTFLLSLLSLLLLLLSLFPQFLCPASNKLLNFLFLNLFLILLNSFSSLQFLCLSLPLNNFSSNDINSLGIINTCRDVVFQLICISLSV